MTLALPQGTQPNSTYTEANQPSASPTSTVASIPSASRPVSSIFHPVPPVHVPSVSNTVPAAFSHPTPSVHHLASSASNTAPAASYPHAPVVSHQPFSPRSLSASQPLPAPHSEGAPPTPGVPAVAAVVAVASPVVSATTPPRTWRPRSQSVNSTPATSKHKPTPDHATLPVESTPTPPTFRSRTSPKVPVRPASMTLPAPVSPKTASRSWPKRNSTEVPIDAATITTLPTIPENLSPYTPPSGNQWTTSGKRKAKPRCTSLPVTRADPPTSTAIGSSTSTSASSSTSTLGRDSLQNLPSPKPRSRFSDPTPSPAPRSALASSQPWIRSTISASKASTYSSQPPKFALTSKTQTLHTTPSDSQIPNPETAQVQMFSTSTPDTQHPDIQHSSQLFQHCKQHSNQHSNQHPHEHSHTQHSHSKHPHSQYSHVQSHIQHSHTQHSNNVHSSSENSNTPPSDTQHDDSQCRDSQHDDSQHFFAQISSTLHQHSSAQSSNTQPPDTNPPDTQHSYTQTTQEQQRTTGSESIGSGGTETQERKASTHEKRSSGVEGEEEELELASRSLSSDEVSSLYAEVVHFIKPYDLPFSPTVAFETHGITVVKPDPTFATTSALPIEPIVPLGFAPVQTSSPFQPYHSPRQSLTSPSEHPESLIDLAPLPASPGKHLLNLDTHSLSLGDIESTFEEKRECTKEQATNNGQAEMKEEGPTL